MSSTPSAPLQPAAPRPPASNRPRLPSWLPSPRALLLIAAAFLAGLGLFALVWYGERDNGFYTVEPVARPRAAADFEPLPAPLPAGSETSASGMGERDEQAREQAPRVVEEVAPPFPPGPVEAPAPPPAPQAPLAAGGAPEPIAGQMPAPEYPRRALRRGIEGTVLVRVQVGPDGVPTSVSLVESSRSRDLDRAALDAVRRWRFRPAQLDGRPTVGSVVIPIDFRAH